MKPEAIYAEAFTNLAELHELAESKGWPDIVAAIEKVALVTWQASLEYAFSESDLECDDVLVRLKLAVRVDVRFHPKPDAYHDWARRGRRAAEALVIVYRVEVETVEHWDELLAEQASAPAAPALRTCKLRHTEGSEFGTCLCDGSSDCPLGHPHLSVL